ncbi:hypothetical protein HNQ48_001721 [Melissococcus plutonius]|nr:hypothetical protein [Melissococcus plutonius]
MHRAYGDAGFWSNAKYTKVPPTGLHYWWAHTN